MFIFAHKKCSHLLIKLRLSHCHLDYFNDVFNNFLRPASFNPYGLVWSDPALRIHQKYNNSCSKYEQRSYRFGTKWGWV